MPLLACITPNKEPEATNQARSPVPGKQDWRKGEETGEEESQHEGTLLRWSLLASKLTWLLNIVGLASGWCKKYCFSKQSIGEERRICPSFSVYLSVYLSTIYLNSTALPAVNE